MPKMTNFPDVKELKSIRKKIARAKGTQGLPPNSSPLDKAKHDVCAQLLIYMKRKGLSHREIARVLDTSETRISEIVHYRINKFTLDRLVAFLQMVRPLTKVKVT